MFLYRGIYRVYDNMIYIIYIYIIIIVNTNTRPHAHLDVLRNNIFIWVKMLINMIHVDVDYGEYRTIIWGSSKSGSSIASWIIFLYRFAWVSSDGSVYII